MADSVTTIDFIRHGEVSGNNYYRGTTDDALTEKGWQQMRDAVAKSEDWQVIISSPLCRCLDFAEQLAFEKQLPLIVEADFKEIHFGDWEGKTAEQIEKIHPDALHRFYQNPLDYPLANGENLCDFQQRLEIAWKKVLENQRGKSVLIVTHAGVIRTLFCLLLKMPLQQSFSIQVDHASLTRFRCFHSESGDFIQLNFHNRLR
jgi:alpha-ribazole phosphatase